MTFATVFKERIAQMPDDINTKKDIEKYYKNLLKEIAEELKKIKPKNLSIHINNLLRICKQKLKKKIPN